MLKKCLGTHNCWNHDSVASDCIWFLLLCFLESELHVLIITVQENQSLQKKDCKDISANLLLSSNLLIIALHTVNLTKDRSKLNRLILQNNQANQSSLLSVQVFRLPHGQCCEKINEKGRSGFDFPGKKTWWHVRISSDITSCCSLLRSIFKSSHHTVTHSLNCNQDEKRKCSWKHFTLLKADSAPIVHIFNCWH